VKKGVNVRPISVELAKGGNLEGWISDTSGAPLSGASIFLLKEASVKYFESYSECITDGSGFFRRQGLKEGRCSILVKHPHFAQYTEKDILISKTETATLSISLDKGTALFVRSEGNYPVALIRDSRIKLTDQSDFNLYGMTSLYEVVDEFFGKVSPGDHGVFLGCLPSGLYQLSLKNPKFGEIIKTVKIAAGEKIHVVKIEAAVDSNQ